MKYDRGSLVGASSNAKALYSVRCQLVTDVVAWPGRRTERSIRAARHGPARGPRQAGTGQVHHPGRYVGDAETVSGETLTIRAYQAR